MNDSALLRAASTLFSKETLISFIFVIIFLSCYKKLNRYTSRIKLPNILISFITAWLVYILLPIAYSLLNELTAFIYHLRFPNVVPHYQFSIDLSGFSLETLFLPVIIAMIYFLYLYINRLLNNKPINILSRSIIDGLIVFLLAYTTVFALNAIHNGLDGIMGSMPIYISAITGCALAFMFYNYHEYLNLFKDHEKELSIAHLQKELAKSQLDALSSKINPHFLYNALNSIAGLSTTDGLKAKNMAITLAKLFRYNINKEEYNYASIADEIEMVKIYLEIEKIRFEEKLQYVIAIPSDIEQETIPKHLLQPLVENAVKHGTGADGIVISIAIDKKGDQLSISVGDNGRPFDSDFTPGYGIKSLYDKLDLLTNGNYEIAFLTNPKVVRIILNKHIRLTK